MIIKDLKTCREGMIVFAVAGENVSFVLYY